MRNVVCVLAATIGLLPLSGAWAAEYQVPESHPRIFIFAEDIPKIAQRCRVDLRRLHRHPKTATGPGRANRMNHESTVSANGQLAFSRPVPLASRKSVCAGALRWSPTQRSPASDRPKTLDAVYESDSILYAEGGQRKPVSLGGGCRCTG